MSDIIVFRERSRILHDARNWVDPAEQFQVLDHLLKNASAARSAGLLPVVCIDLDLTTLLAHAKSIAVLEQLAPSAADLPGPTEQADLLASIWRGERHALLPGYTSTAIAAYGIFMAACLEQRTGRNLGDDRAACEQWISSSVHALLRNGYWDRDVAADTFSPGFAGFASELAARGASIVFLSNRDPSLRTISAASLTGLLGNAAPLFAFFGPGGSAFDASSKAVAVKLIEDGVAAGVHHGKAVGGQTIFDEADPGDITNERQVVIAVIDDRAENRRQVIGAAARSAAILGEAGLGPPLGIACAAPGFCPEVDVVATPGRISCFTTRE